MDKTPANCRQIFKRSRQHLATRKPDFDSQKQQDQLTEKFLQAWNTGDLQALLMLLAQDITLYSDGGGKVTAALKPIHTAKVARFLLAIRRSKKVSSFVCQLAQINYQSGIITYVAGYVHSILTFDVFDGKIKSIYAVVNPDKLSKVSE